MPGVCKGGADQVLFHAAVGIALVHRQGVLEPDCERVAGEGWWLVWAGGRVAEPWLLLQPQVFWSDQHATAGQDGVSHGVLEFAHVARPGVGEELREGCGGEAAHRAAHLLAVAQ